MKSRISKSLEKNIKLYRRGEDSLPLEHLTKLIFIARGYTTQDSASKADI